MESAKCIGIVDKIIEGKKSGISGEAIAGAQANAQQALAEPSE